MNERNKELLQAYLDGELDTDAHQDLEQRLASDPALKDELTRLSFVRDSIKSLPKAEAPVNLADEILRRARETAPTPAAASPGQGHTGPVPWSTPWRVAAGIALLLLPGSGFAAGYGMGISRAPGSTSTPETVLAVASDGQNDFLVLLHGSAGEEGLAVEQRSWRDLQYADWADRLVETGTLVRADDLSEDSGQGVWADGTVDPGETWFAGAWTVPTRAYVVRAWDYDEALEVARTSPHLAFGGSVTVRMITEGL
jgi:hypothetical protein